MHYNKQSIEKTIAQLEKAVAMEAHIRSKLAEFKHHKQVNKRFLDALEESGEYHAYISSDKYHGSMCVYPTGEPYSDRIEFKIYLSHLITKQQITWELIESELVRHKFTERLTDFNKKLRVFDSEKLRIKELHEFMEKINLECFDLYNVKYELRKAAEYAELVKE